MTRENKLALVIGFGLILLVGILVSDHFSAAQRQESAELVQIADPLDPARWDNPELIAYRSGVVDPHAAAAAGGWSTEVAAPPVRPALGPGVSTGGVRPVDPIVTNTTTGRPPAFRVADDAAARVVQPRNPTALRERHHDVQPGEALARICRRYYGDPSLTEALAAFNDIREPDHVPAGRRLRIPDATVLGGAPALASGMRSGAPSGGPAVTPASRTPRRYTVREGDSLSEIAQKLLGSGRRYPKLYEHNKDVLKSPDALRPGMVLKIPASS